MTRKALESGELRRARIAGPVLDSTGGIWRPKTISMEPTVKVCDYKSSKHVQKTRFPQLSLGALRGIEWNLGLDAFIDHIKWIKVDKPDEYQMINLLSERLPRCLHEAVGIWTARLPAAMNPSEPRAPSPEPRAGQIYGIKSRRH